MLEKMFARKLVDKPRLLALRRDRAIAEGAVGEYRAAIARARQGILAARLQTAELEAQAMKEIDEALRVFRARAYELSQQLAAAQDVLRRTSIRSPIDGTVIGLQVYTVGGVIAAGEPLLEIVPAHEQLVVQASIDPRDIDQVRVGLPASVELTAFNHRVRAPVEGQVTTVSANSLTDPATSLRYYRARISVVPGSLQAHSIALQPGMAADVLIRTGSRPPLEYLLTPITRTLDHALRED